jgi:hypothetical protein
VQLVPARRGSVTLAGQHSDNQQNRPLPRTTMHHAELTQSVRRRVVDAFAHLRLAESSGDPRETLLIRGGAYCGRRFDLPSGHALWFFEEDQLKLYSADGRLLHVVQQISAPAPVARLAA